MTEYVHQRSILGQTQVCPLNHGRGIQKQDKKPLSNKEKKAGPVTGSA